MSTILEIQATTERIQSMRNKLQDYEKGSNLHKSLSEAISNAQERLVRMKAERKSRKTSLLDLKKKKRNGNG
jgi:uncharacterized protein with PhoU and TrkA domain